ncbi:MAG TPA: hypothetical protein VFW05_19465 [Verrucomicrobiae bacterium]|nr:hypothetical protein [Verrucomicrobiae bacterium]
MNLHLETRTGEAIPLARLCSDHQGFMNGGAETGRQAALAIQKTLHGWRQTA